MLQLFVIATDISLTIIIRLWFTKKVDPTNISKLLENTAMESLLLEIEQKRYDLLNTVKMYGLKSKEAITLSQELDELLNTYNTSLNKTSDFTHIQRVQ